MRPSFFDIFSLIVLLLKIVLKLTNSPMNEILSSQKNSLIISESVRSNLKFLSSILDANDNSLMSISSSEPEFLIIEEDEGAVARKYYPLIRSLLENSKDPFKCVGIYSKLLANRMG